MRFEYSRGVLRVSLIQRLLSGVFHLENPEEGTFKMRC